MHIVAKTFAIQFFFCKIFIGFICGQAKKLKIPTFFNSNGQSKIVFIKKKGILKSIQNSDFSLSCKKDSYCSSYLVVIQPLHPQEKPEKNKARGSLQPFLAYLLTTTH